MPSAEASHSRAEAGGLPPLVGVIARLVALIIAVSLISWLIGLSDVGTASLLLGASTVAVMVGLLGLGYWRSLSRVEGQAAVDEPRSESIERDQR
jgi:high-affinity Fe2+/Pb2+ permease